MREMVKLIIILFTGGLCCFLVASLEAASPGNRPVVWQRYPNIVNSNSIPVTFQVEGEAPEFMAIVVEESDGFPEWDEDPAEVMAKWRAEMTNHAARAAAAAKPKHPFDNAQWIPFRTNVMVNLGPGDGDRSILFSYRYKGQTSDSGYTGGGVTVRTKRPVIRMINPTNLVTSQPIIQLQGRADHDLGSVRFDQFDQQGRMVVNNGEGFAGGTYMGDPNNISNLRGFTCFDVKLSTGTNTFVLRCTDDAGNLTTTNAVVVFTTEGDLTAPSLELYWPKSGAHIAGNTATIRGRTDDPTAKMTGEVCAGDTVTMINGFSERGGMFWYMDVALAEGANTITLTATDSAGNSNSINLVLYGTTSSLITVDPIEPNTLWNSQMKVSGHVTPPNRKIWINGVQADVMTDGTWTAHNVPVNSAGGGTTTFDITAVPTAGATNNLPSGQDQVAAQTKLGTNATVVNATSPACGVFQLLLSETGGRGFVLMASTNLTEWTPILTNAHPPETFSYTDLEATKHACRFFKIVPLK